MHTRPRTDDRYCAKCGGELELRVLKPENKERLACRECGAIRYLDPRVAAGTITVHDGGIVLLRRALAPRIGRWVFPGGYVDRGEPVDAAAVRETSEEVGLKVSLIGILDAYSYEGEDVVLIVYSADVIGGERYRFNEPKYFTINAKGWIFVSDEFNNQIKILNEKHEIVGLIGTGKPGLGPNQFNQPEGVEVRGNTLWVSDTHNDRITRFTLEGMPPER